MTDHEFRIQPISEADIGVIIGAAGGQRAHLHALALAAAYALANDVESVLWQKDMRYAWQ